MSNLNKRAPSNVCLLVSLLVESQYIEAKKQIHCVKRATSADLCFVYEALKEKESEFLGPTNLGFSDFEAVHHIMNKLTSLEQFPADLLLALKHIKLNVKRRRDALRLRQQPAVGMGKKVPASQASVPAAGSGRTIRVPSLTPVSGSEIPCVRKPMLVVDGAGVNAPRSTGLSRSKQAA